MAESTGALQAVGHPVRLRMLQRLAGGAGASIAELADAAGVHENTVRAHVAALEEGGLVAGEPRPAAGPGRPGVEYRLTPAGERLDQDFLGLAELLAAVVGRAGLSDAQLREVGREWGRYLIGRPGQYDPRERIPQVLARLGFDAAIEGDRVRLSGCPCPTVASDRPELLCELITGVLDGVLAAAGARQRVGEGSHDPSRRRCEVRLVDLGDAIAAADAL
jgi:predicted ArsR family transcriptional regulator